METPSHFSRSSGILAHLTSLPSPYGIGDLGPEAREFIDYLVAARQSIWQILPLGPTDDSHFHSPYMSVSAFAGNPLLISPERLYQEGFLQKSDLQDAPSFSPYQVKFSDVLSFKTDLLKKAFIAFSKIKNVEYDAFIESSSWLTDYSLFMALKKHLKRKAWYQWDNVLRFREPQTIDRARKELTDDIKYYYFEQFLFHSQWCQLHDYATDNGIQLFGDIPIYVSLDSADVWGNQSIFQLDDKTGRPTSVAGVPPDYFSETGQKWGNPLYNWHAKESEKIEALYTWWIRRFKEVFNLVDIARVDHFRGFESYFAIPEKDENAVNGKWHKGPGRAFFDTVFNSLGPLAIVAEDLGEITEDVHTLRKMYDFPGMKILQFAFDGSKDNSFLPFNYQDSNYFVYTGTHDNDTSIGWYLDSRIDDTMRSSIRGMANKKLNDTGEIHEDLIFMAMSSIATVCIFPLQDILGFGSDCRMNTPGTTKDNWKWRCSKEFLTTEKAEWLAQLTQLFGRLPKHGSKSDKTFFESTTLS